MFNGDCVFRPALQRRKRVNAAKNRRMTAPGGFALRPAAGNLSAEAVAENAHPAQKTTSGHA